MPGIEPVPGIEEGGRFYVKGPNVMLGYMLDKAPGERQPASPWYDTGDIVDFNDDGFVRIKGRAKRFAKIGGEMVSLGAVENLAAELLPSFRHAAISCPDARKGEQVVIVTEDASMTRASFQAFAKGKSTPEIMLPREIIHVATLPLLGSGKTDYPAIEAIGREPDRQVA
jgi:acyl-[acyl-carrier-protein]-phospholipid O-acyltransferase/long-chain-fatty-acid--[acyl-carrier-protein] ligase